MLGDPERVAGFGVEEEFGGVHGQGDRDGKKRG